MSGCRLQRLGGAPVQIGALGRAQPRLDDRPEQGVPELRLRGRQRSENPDLSRLLHGVEAGGGIEAEHAGHVADAEAFAEDRGSVQHAPCRFGQRVHAASDKIAQRQRQRPLGHDPIRHRPGDQPARRRTAGCRR